MGKGAGQSLLLEGVDAQHLKNQAEGHRWNAETMVTDSAHADQPGDEDWRSQEPGEEAVLPLERTEPEEADKEE